MQIAYAILHLLSDGSFHSGNGLAKRLQISRTHVWNGITFLRRAGVVIHAIPGKGYRWSHPIELLRQDDIMCLVSPDIKRVDVCHIVTSTNDYLLQRIAIGLQSGSVCTAECQTAGRGRLGRKWISPYGSNIYLSLYWHFSRVSSDLCGLSLVVGLAMMEALGQLVTLPAGLGIKWPNDLWYQGAKLGGILIETVPNPTCAGTHVIIGMGVNVNRVPSFNPLWTDLYRVLGVRLSRNRLIAYILNALVNMLQQFQQEGFLPFMPQWSRYDVLAGNNIQLVTPQGGHSGIAKGVNARGELCVCIGTTLSAFRYGEVSVSHAGSV